MIPVKSRVLVLFSGGKDSFLSACRLIMDGYTADLISFNNGAVANEKILAKSAQRLVNRYGESRVKYAGCYNTAAVVQSLSGWQSDAPWSELGSRYPDLYISQARCLACQTAMWAAGIAYAVARRIPAAACGYKASDVYCTGEQAYWDRVSAMASAHGIRLLRPVWDDTAWLAEPGDMGRNLEMENAGFSPVAFEPKCLIGRPADRMGAGGLDCMERYLDDVLVPAAREEIAHLVPVFRTLRLTPESLHAIDYPIPDGSHGLY